VIAGAGAGAGAGVGDGLDEAEEGFGGGAIGEAFFAVGCGEFELVTICHQLTALPFGDDNQKNNNQKNKGKREKRVLRCTQDDNCY